MSEAVLTAEEEVGIESKRKSYFLSFAKSVAFFTLFGWGAAFVLQHLIPLFDEPFLEMSLGNVISIQLLGFLFLLLLQGALVALRKGVTALLDTFQLALIKKLVKELRK